MLILACYRAAAYQFNENNLLDSYPNRDIFFTSFSSSSLLGGSCSDAIISHRNTLPPCSIPLVGGGGGQCLSLEGGGIGSRCNHRCSNVESNNNHTNGGGNMSRHSRLRTMKILLRRLLSSKKTIRRSGGRLRGDDEQKKAAIDNPNKGSIYSSFFPSYFTVCLPRALHTTRKHDYKLQSKAMSQQSKLAVSSPSSPSSISSAIKPSPLLGISTPHYNHQHHRLLVIRGGRGNSSYGRQTGRREQEEEEEEMKYYLCEEEDDNWHSDKEARNATEQPSNPHHHQDIDPLLLVWLEKNNVQMEKVKLSHIEGKGLGVIATEDIQVNESFFSIPVDLALTLDDADRGPLHKAWEKTFLHNPEVISLIKKMMHSIPLSERSALWRQVKFCLLLVLYRRKYCNPQEYSWIDTSEYTQVSDFGPFFLSLPERYSDVLWWSDDEIEFLRGTPLYDYSVRQRMGLSHIRRVITQYLIPHFTPLHGLKHEELIWAWSTFRSRSFGDESLIKGQEFVLLPILDYLNHNVDSHVNWVSNVTISSPSFPSSSSSSSMPAAIKTMEKRRSGRIGYVAKRHIFKGEEVMTSYGIKGNDVLLSGYGFVEANNTLENPGGEIPSHLAAYMRKPKLSNMRQETIERAMTFSKSRKGEFSAFGKIKILCLPGPYQYFLDHDSFSTRSEPCSNYDENAVSVRTKNMGKLSSIREDAITELHTLKHFIHDSRKQLVRLFKEMHPSLSTDTALSSSSSLPFTRGNFLAARTYVKTYVKKLESRIHNMTQRLRFSWGRIMQIDTAFNKPMFFSHNNRPHEYWNTTTTTSVDDAVANDAEEGGSHRLFLQDFTRLVRSLTLCKNKEEYRVLMEKSKEEKEEEEGVFSDKYSNETEPGNDVIFEVPIKHLPSPHMFHNRYPEIYKLFLDRISSLSPTPTFSPGRSGEKKHHHHHIDDPKDDAKEMMVLFLLYEYSKGNSSDLWPLLRDLPKPQSSILYRIAKQVQEDQPNLTEVTLHSLRNISWIPVTLQPALKEILLPSLERYLAYWTEELLPKISPMTTMERNTSFDGSLTPSSSSSSLISSKASLASLLAPLSSMSFKESPSPPPAAAAAAPAAARGSAAFLVDFPLYLWACNIIDKWSYGIEPPLSSSSSVSSSLPSSSFRSFGSVPGSSQPLSSDSNNESSLFPVFLPFPSEVIRGSYASVEEVQANRGTTAHNRENNINYHYVLRLRKYSNTAEAAVVAAAAGNQKRGGQIFDNARLLLLEDQILYESVN